MIPKQFIDYPTVAAARREIQYLLEENRGSACVQFLLGPTRVGKSELVREILQEKRFAPYRDDGGLVQPAVYVEAPEQGTVIGLVEKLLQALQDRHFTKGTGTERKLRLFHYLEQQRTELIVIDEVQQLSRANPYDYADFLKSMENNVKCMILCVGLSDAIALTRYNEQLAHRAEAPIELRPLDWFVEPDRKTFRQILQAFRKIIGDRFDDLQIERGALAAAIHLATGGAIGVVARLLSRAIMEADLKGKRMIELQHLSHAYERLAKNRFKRLEFNPFEIAVLPERWEPMPFEAGARQKPSKAKRAA